MIKKSPEASGVRAAETPAWHERVSQRARRIAGGMAVCAIAATMIAPAAHAEVPAAMPQAPVAVQAGAVNGLGDFLDGVKVAIPESQGVVEMIAPEKAKKVADLSGANSQLMALGQINGTDLGITFETSDGYGMVVGDSFLTNHPGEGTAGWQSNAMFHSSNKPDANNLMQFEYAYGANGGNDAPELIPSPHDTSGTGEWSAIPNDVVQLSNGDMVMSYQSVRHWNSDEKQEWVTNYAGLAVSKDGGHTWDRDAGPKWMNDEGNNSPDQMVSMQRDDDGYVYMASVKSGRQYGDMVLKRVHEDDILNKAAYEQLGTPFSGNFGEPSLRKLDDGTWMIAYLDKTRNAIYSRVASSPAAGWSAEKMQVPGYDVDGEEGVQNLYGGFIHPASTKGNVVFTVSQWKSDAYKISQYAGTAYGHPAV